MSCLTRLRYYPFPAWEQCAVALISSNTTGFIHIHELMPGVIIRLFAPRESLPEKPWDAMEDVDEPICSTPTNFPCHHPACEGVSRPALYPAGVLASDVHRIAHALMQYYVPEDHPDRMARRPEEVIPEVMDFCYLKTYGEENHPSNQSNRALPKYRLVKQNGYPRNQTHCVRSGV